MIKIRVKATPEYFIVKRSREGLISLLAFLFPHQRKPYNVIAVYDGVMLTHIFNSWDEAVAVDILRKFQRFMPKLANSPSYFF